MHVESYADRAHVALPIPASAPPRPDDTRRRGGRQTPERPRTGTGRTAAGASGANRGERRLAARGRFDRRAMPSGYSGRAR
ncbi:hypothetical protein GCM10010222_50820 [Streptomyces tanashiensis]|nr:hypothetical protein GCM10010222_50820 [Streptomyces tanashiensis]